MAGPNTPFFYRSGGGSSSSGSGGTGKNYLTAYKASTGSGAANTGNGDLELGATTGFSLGNVGTLTNGIPTGTTPTFGSGANGNLSLAIASTSTLGGNFSIDMISAAATTAGDCIATSAFNIDAEDQAKVLSFKIAYKAQTNPTNGNWSGTSSNSYGVAVWDATNSVFLGVQGQFNIVQSSGIGYATGTVQTGSTTASMRIMIYNVSASSGAITLRTDDWSIGPQVSPQAPAIDDWVAYTPTFTGYGSPTSVNFFSKRVGDSLEVQGTFICGTSTATPNAISVGYKGVASNVTIDTAKIIASSSCGYAQNSVSSTTFFGLGVLAANVTTKDVTLTLQTSTANPQAGTLNGSTVASSGQTFNMWFKVPIVGWSSNSVSSSDTDTRVVAMQVSQASPTATITGSYSLLKFTSAPAQDTHGSFSTSTGQYTCPVSGFYRCTASANIAATYANANQTSIAIGRNSVTVATISSLQIAGAAEAVLVPVVVGTIYCNAGDTLNPLVFSGGTTPTLTASALYNYFHVERLSGPAVITATESVNGRYHGCTATVTASLSNVTYTTKDYDSHAAYSGATLTIPVSGKYQFNAGISVVGTYALNTNLIMDILKNGAQYTETAYQDGGATAAAGLTITDVVPCNAGDTIVIQVSCSATSPTINASNFRNYFSWSRVGN